MDEKRREVRQYLEAIKALVNRGAWHTEPRNYDTLGLLGIAIREVRDMLLSLRVEDYCKGPEADRDLERPGDIWLFWIDVPDSAVLHVYVKLKTDPNMRHVTVLSFHPEEHGITRYFT